MNHTLFADLGIFVLLSFFIIITLLSVKLNQVFEPTGKSPIFYISLILLSYWIGNVIVSFASEWLFKINSLPLNSLLCAGVCFVIYRIGRKRAETLYKEMEYLPLSAEEHAEQ